MLAIPSQKLWNPRFSVPNWLAAHIKKSASTGRLLKTSTGHLAKNCDSVECGVCADGIAPVVMRATIESLTPCCRIYAGGNILMNNIDGTYDLDEFSSGSFAGGGGIDPYDYCAWNLDVLDENQLYDAETDCTGDVSLTDDISLTYEVRRYTTTSEISKLFYISVSMAGFDGEFAFYQEINLGAIPDPDCWEGDVFDTSTTTCEELGGPAGEGGTVTVVSV